MGFLCVFKKKYFIEIICLAGHKVLFTLLVSHVDVFSFAEVHVACLQRGGRFKLLVQEKKISGAIDFLCASSYFFTTNPVQYLMLLILVIQLNSTHRN